MALCSCGGAFDFYPRSPCGERHLGAWKSCDVCNFYPRSPCGERRHLLTHHRSANRFLSTLSLRRATYQANAVDQILPGFLSTLSLRRATTHPVGVLITIIISIHALLAESDGIGLVFMWWGVRFLSTLSLRRATSAPRITPTASRNFYPRSPCGERQARKNSRCPCLPISIHALLAESDSQQPDGTTSTTYFYPRSPCGERHTS